MKLLRYVFLIVGLMSLVPKDVDAQVDTLFWFAAPWVSPDHWWQDPIAFHFSTFDNPTTIRIQQPTSTYDTTFTVPANSFFTKELQHILDSVESKPADQVLRTGIKITSDFPMIVVYNEITRAPNLKNPETYSLKGRNGMGTEFVLPYQTLWNNRTLPGDVNGDGEITQAYQQFSVVATEDSTTIYITPSCSQVGGHEAGVTYSVLLPKKGNVYTGQNITQKTSTSLDSNMTGTIVSSDKPISVTVTDDSVQPQGGGSCFDLIGDQIVPVDVVGDEYIVNKGTLNAGSNESVFIIGTENFTTVNIDDGIGAVTTVILNQGESYPYSVIEDLIYMKSDKPIYVFHFSGFGCEAGAAILPPLNCAGSDRVSFVRLSHKTFALNILCPSGAEGNFTLNGSTTLVEASDFNPVPGTGGAWLGAQIEFDKTEIPLNIPNSISNSSDFFSLGVIGHSGGGALYHYISSFLRPVFTDAGSDANVCDGEPVIDLSGSVTGAVSTGIWSVLNGTGTLNNPTNLTTTYEPSANDYNQGTLTFVLASTGVCNPETDTLVVTFVASPDVNAGADGSYCRNNVSAIPLSGTIANAAGGSWSGGVGGAFGNSSDLNTTYSPSPTDLLEDSLILYLTSAGSFFACPEIQDSVILFFTDPPVVSVGADRVVCASDSEVSLSGTVTGASSTGMWTTTGSGIFDPSNTDLNADYLVTSADTAGGSLFIYLSSTGNGNCLAVTDSFKVTFLEEADIEITTSDSICSDLTFINLTGTMSAGFSPTWSTTGAGSIDVPSSLNTNYNLSPIDINNGFVDIFLSSNAAVCPVKKDSLRITFVDQSNVFAGDDQEFCSNTPVQLEGTVVGSSSDNSWTSTGTGSFTPSNNLLSTFYIPSASDISNGGVSLILSSAGNFGCVAEKDTVEITFKSPPVVDFSYVPVCLGENTVFTDISTTTDGTINSWNYDFGDFNTSTSANPEHDYAASGDYTVTLVVGSSNGCFDTIQKTVTVNPLPLADFTYGLACKDEPVQFNNVSFISSGDIVEWEYSYGDNTSATGIENPTHTFNSGGEYTVTQTVTSDFGCVGTVSKPVTVLDGPNAEFNMDPSIAIALEDVSFTDQSTGNQIGNWVWDFGDETGGNNQNEVHDYSEGGDYRVNLTVTDVDGCKDSISKILTVVLMPVLPTAFTPDGDGENDVFIIRGGPFVSVNFKVYNNWGELLFETNDASIGWDGTYKGKEAIFGVYTWTFKVELIGERIIKQSGDVTLIR